VAKSSTSQHKKTIENYQAIFGSPEGRAVLIDLVKASQLFTVTGNRPDSELQHLEGSRDMVRRIVSLLSIDENKLLQLAMIGEKEDG
jgi:hypothetical protein